MNSVRTHVVRGKSFRDAAKEAYAVSYYRKGKDHCSYSLQMKEGKIVGGQRSVTAMLGQRRDAVVSFPPVVDINSYRCWMSPQFLAHIHLDDFGTHFGLCCET